MWSVGNRAFASIAFVFVLSAAFAGCLGDPKKPDSAEHADRPLAIVTEDLAGQLAALQGIESEPYVVKVKPTIQIVFAGVPPERVDEDAIRKHLPGNYSPINTARTGTWAREYHEPLLYEYNYEFQQAPDAFATEFFAYAQSVAREVAPTPFLCAYDREWAHNRLSQHGPPEVCYKGYASYDSGVILPPGQPDAMKKILLVPVEKTEAWIAENRERFGLTFDQPSYTFFFFDSWTTGLMPKDTYYYYESTQDSEQNVDTQTLRAWGGSYDFLYLDLSAAPNNALYDNSEKVWFITRLGVTAGYGTAERDPPIWDYDENGHWERTVCRLETGFGATQGACPSGLPDGTAGPEGQAANVRYETRTIEFNDALGEDVRYGLQLYVMPSYVYRPEYQPVYFVNFHLYQESESIKPKEDIAGWVDLDAILGVLRTEIPWATFDGELKAYLLPNDDPGMALAIKRAKAEGYGTYVPTRPIQNYVDANLDRYVQNANGVFDVKVFGFNWDAHWTVAFPLVVSGVGAGDAEGRPWGILENVNDVEYYAYDPGNGHEYTHLTAHEVGHFFGFHHPHDGAVRLIDPSTGEHGEYDVTVEWTWDQTATPMSYRMSPPQAGQMDRDHIARGHTALNVNDALKNVKATLEVLVGEGVTKAPAPVARELEATQESVATTLDLYEEGQWIDAVHGSIAALEHSKAARAAANANGLEAVELDSWSADSVTRPAKRVPGVPFVTGAAFGAAGTSSNVNAYYDYHAIALDPSFEKVVVEVAWANTQSGSADLFAGWSFDDPSELPPGQRGTYDFVPELAADGSHVQRFVLDLNYTDVWRDGLGSGSDSRSDGKIWVGAGSTEPMANGAYKVTATAYVRTVAAAEDDAEPTGGAPPRSLASLLADWRDG